ncbi:hypothetical protein ACRRTK_017074 [Alexandromys fortis]
MPKLKSNMACAYFYFKFIFVCVLPTWISVPCSCSCPLLPAEGIRSPELKLQTCEPPVSTENSAWVLYKNNKSSNQLSFSPVLSYFLLIKSLPLLHSDWS